MLSPVARQLDAGQPINWAHPLNHDLRSKWLVSPAGHPSYRGGGTLRDLCRRNNGTLTGGVAWNGSYARKGGWGCLEFDGTDDYIPITHTASLVTSAGLTVSVWVQIDVNTQYDMIVSKTNGTNWTQGWGIYLQGAGSGTLSWFAGSYGTNLVTTANSSIVAGTWYHLVGTWDGSTSTSFYLNGTLVGSATAGTVDTTNGLEIGRGNSNSFNLDGRLDDVAILGRPWSAAQVKQYYDLSRQGYYGILNRTKRSLLNSVAAAAAAGRFLTLLGAGR